MKITLLLLCLAMTAHAAKDWPPKLLSVMDERDPAKQLAALKEKIKAGADLNAPIGFSRMLKVNEDPSALRPTNWPLNTAIIQGHVETVDFLLANGAQMHGGELVQAAMYLKPDESLIMTAALLRAGADVNSLSEDHTFSALIWASVTGRIKVVKLLLAQRGIELNLVNGDGNTALVGAVEKGYVEIVQALVKAGADLRMPNRKGELPVALAMKNPDHKEALVAALQAAPK